HLMQKYGDERLPLAAYNAGQQNVDSWRAEGKGFQFPETRAYVEKVERLKGIYRRTYSRELGLNRYPPAGGSFGGGAVVGGAASEPGQIPLRAFSTENRS